VDYFVAHVVTHFEQEVRNPRKMRFQAVVIAISPHALRNFVVIGGIDNCPVRPDTFLSQKVPLARRLPETN
jgi:hypothetical protein